MISEYDLLCCFAMQWQYTVRLYYEFDCNQDKVVLMSILSDDGENMADDWRR
jgi:hypothetical protein